MERKTMREDRTHVSVFGDDAIYFSRDLPHIREAINLLAEYEDTGLTPEDFAAAGQMKHFKEWREWHKADAEKRLVVLPCKVGETVFVLHLKFGSERPEIVEERVVQLFCDEKDGWSINTLGECCGGIYSFSLQGKKWFLAREDAEAALAKEGGNDGE